MNISDVSEKILAKIGKNRVKIPNPSVPLYDKAVEIVGALSDDLEQDWGMIQHRYFIRCNNVSFVMGGCAVGACFGLYFGVKKAAQKIKEYKASCDETQKKQGL